MRTKYYLARVKLARPWAATRLAAALSLLSLLVGSSPAIAQANGPVPDVRVVELTVNPSGEELANARKEYRAGSVVRMEGATFADLRRLLGVGASEVHRFDKQGATNKSGAVLPSTETPAAEPTCVAVRHTSAGALHEFISFAKNDASSPDACGGAFLTWFDRHLGEPLLESKPVSGREGGHLHRSCLYSEPSPAAPAHGFRQVLRWRRPGNFGL